MQYRLNGRDSMVARIKWMRLAFEALLREGLNGTGLRMLDHGVCAGLLSLLYSTFFFNIYFGLKRAIPTRPSDARLIERFQRKKYRALWWFKGVLWGTAAAALHNLQQQLSSIPVSGVPEKLRLEEDPIAYLGILVDCVQEWDRYGVSREGVIGGALPLQAVDVGMSSDQNGISIKYGDSERAGAVQKLLNSALQNWQEILTVS
jgi:hypothetical protein